MKIFLVATTNPAKFKEVQAILANDDIQILGLKDFPNVRKIEEVGETFEENAFLKTVGYYWQTKIPCIADDGGLMIDYLGGAPGVASHRWIGEDATDEERVQAVLERMKDVPREKRTARLGGFVVYYDGRRLLKRENWIHGYIAENLMDNIEPGFPYRPILMIPQFKKPYSALSHEEHEQVNFRRKSIHSLKTEILK